MALTPLVNGDTGEEALDKINAGFTQTDTNEANTAVIQSKSFMSLSAASISNTSSTVHVDTDLIVAITPKSASSKLRVEFNAHFENTANGQTGVKGHIQKKVGAGAWTDILFGNQTNNFTERNSNVVNSGSRWEISSRTQIDSPGIEDEIKFKVTFAPITDTINMTYSDSRGIAMITVDEILE